MMNHEEHEENEEFAFTTKVTKGTKKCGVKRVKREVAKSRRGVSFCFGGTGASPVFSFVLRQARHGLETRVTKKALRSSRGMGFNWPLHFRKQDTGEALVATTIREEIYVAQVFIRVFF